MYLIIDTATNLAAVVDPVDPAAIQAAAARHGATIVAICTTHSHWDHHGGNLQLLKECGTIRECYGGRGDGVDGCTVELDDASTFAVGETAFTVLFTPCHTPGHVCYVADGRHVFTGDTLFVSGCGNFNNGTAAQMMAEKIVPCEAKIEQLREDAAGMLVRPRPRPAPPPAPPPACWCAGRVPTSCRRTCLRPASGPPMP